MLFLFFSCFVALRCIGTELLDLQRVMYFSRPFRFFFVFRAFTERGLGIFQRTFACLPLFSCGCAMLWLRLVLIGSTAMPPITNRPVYWPASQPHCIYACCMVDWTRPGGGKVEKMLILYNNLWFMVGCFVFLLCFSWWRVAFACILFFPLLLEFDSWVLTFIYFALSIDDGFLEIIANLILPQFNMKKT